MRGMKGKFEIENKDIEAFWTLYLENMDNNLGIAEILHPTCPVIVDVDIKLPATEDVLTKYKGGEHIYTPRHVTEVVRIYQDVLREIVRDCTSRNLMCLLLEKPKYRIKDDIKSGFHLHFPSCFMPKHVLFTEVVPRVKRILGNEQTFLDLGIGDSGGVIDGCCNNWLLYGSLKQNAKVAYKVTAAFDDCQVKIDIEDALENYPLFDVHSNIISFAKENVFDYMPRILSVIPQFRMPVDIITNTDTEDMAITHDPSPNEPESFNEDTPDSNLTRKVQEDLRLAERILPLLSLSRAQDYGEWINVGFILYSVGRGSSKAYDLWVQFSKRAPNFDEDACEASWGRMHVGKYRINSLCWLARNDDESGFRRVAEGFSVQLSLTDTTQWDIARVMEQEFKGRFVCTSIRRKSWYEFNGHVWKPSEEGTSLRKLISTHVLDMYRLQLRESMDIAQEEDDEESATFAKKIFGRIEKDLKSAGYKNKIMEEARELFFDENFENLLDADPNLIAFSNGIYDLKSNIFRSGLPGDYISKAMPIKYHPELTVDHPKVKEVMHMLETLFPDPELLDFFLYHYSNIFEGGNKLKAVIFWTGVGNNGKSVLQTFFERMLGLGAYCVKLNTKIITGQKPLVGSACPDLSRSKGVRLATMEEPNINERINIGVYKLLAGNDAIWMRDLYMSGRETNEFTPMFKLTFISNDPPVFDRPDQATWNRTFVLPFESEFVDAELCADLTFEEQKFARRFPMDPSFVENKLHHLIEPLAWYLLHYRHHLRPAKCSVPAKVKEATEAYKYRNDVIKQWMDEHVQEKETGCISLSVIYNNYKMWYQDSGFHGAMLTRNELLAYFAKLWGRPDSHGNYHGFEFKEKNGYGGGDDTSTTD